MRKNLDVAQKPPKKAYKKRTVAITPLSKNHPVECMRGGTQKILWSTRDEDRYATGLSNTFRLHCYADLRHQRRKLVC